MVYNILITTNKVIKIMEVLSMNNIDIEKARIFAEKQMLRNVVYNEDTSDMIGFKSNDQWIINPWYDRTGSFELSDDQMVKMYGLDNVISFVENALL